MISNSAPLLYKPTVFLLPHFYSSYALGYFKNCFLSCHFCLSQQFEGSQGCRIIWHTTVLLNNNYNLILSFYIISIVLHHIYHFLHWHFPLSLLSSDIISFPIVIIIICHFCHYIIVIVLYHLSFGRPRMANSTRQTSQ